jgi:hypothetical protein
MLTSLKLSRDLTGGSDHYSAVITWSYRRADRYSAVVIWSYQSACSLLFSCHVILKEDVLTTLQLSRDLTECSLQLSHDLTRDSVPYYAVVMWSWTCSLFCSCPVILQEGVLSILQLACDLTRKSSHYSAVVIKSHRRACSPFWSCREILKDETVTVMMWRSTECVVAITDSMRCLN